MPIEIKELVIRAVVDPVGPARGQGAAEPGAATASATEERDTIIAAAVREVLRILRAANER